MKPADWFQKCYTNTALFFFFWSSCAGRGIVMGKELKLKEGNILKERNGVTQPKISNIGDQL